MDFHEIDARIAARSSRESCVFSPPLAFLAARISLAATELLWTKAWRHILAENVSKWIKMAENGGEKQ